MRVTYIGHATLLLELGGARFLTDPNFDSKLGRILPRVSAPGIALDELPALDAILLTHAHADHLSFDSIERLPRTIPLFAPPVVAKWLRRLGRDPADKSKENTMRAVTVRDYGGTPAVAEIPTPEPGARQILIRLRDAGMNPMDLWLASGAWQPEDLRRWRLVSPCVHGYRLEDGEWKNAHRYRDNNIWLDQARQ